MKMARVSEMAKVADALGVNPQTVRYGLEQGVLPFGAAIKCDKRYSYVFFAPLVERYLGVKLGNDEEEN